MRHFLQKFTMAMAAAAVVLSGFTAKAAPSNVPENKPCSLTVTMKEHGSGAAASGESIAIYRVGSEGSENGNYHFYYTADVFAEQYQAASGDRIPDEVVTSEESSKRFAQAAKELVPDAQKKTDPDGKASFANLPHGLYLVVQKDPSDRYLSFDPFLVSLPAYDKVTENYVYEVYALPKVQKEVNRYTPAAADPGVLKRVVGDGAPSSQTFRMVFHRLDASFPMMEGSTGDSKTMDIAADNAVHEFGTLTFTRAGDYYYEIYEDRSNAAENFTYDATVYRLEYQVRRAAGNALSVQRVIIRLNDAEGVVVYDGTDTAQHVVITNTYKAPGGGNNGGSEEPPVTPPAANVESVHITGAKIWNDNNNEAGNRPGSITVHLYANGTEVASTSVSGDWSFDFGSWTVWQSGNRISYTIAEDGVTGYTASYTTSASGSSLVFQLTNTSNASVQGVSREQNTAGTGDSGDGVQSAGSGSGTEGSVLGASRLPQTGQLWWPVWLMAGAGSLLILLGLSSRRKAKA